MTAQGLTLLSIVGAGLAAGTFFSFSTFVVPALLALPPSEGASAMQSINEVVLGSSFMLVLFGTCASSLLLVLVGFSSGHPPLVRALWIAGGMLYLCGVGLVTALGNVPLNEALASVAPEDAPAMWLRHASEWAAWNHVRAAAGTASLVAYVFALRLT